MVKLKACEHLQKKLIGHKKDEFEKSFLKIVQKKFFMIEQENAE
jgi:nucleoside diphosphate kinase